MTLLFAVVALAAADPQSAFDAFFSEFAQKRDAVHVLEARFTQENITAEETVPSEGSLVYVKPRRIVFRYERPDKGVTYLIDNHKAYEFEPDIKQLQVFDLEEKTQTEIFFLGFDDNTVALRRDYDVALFNVKEAGLAPSGILIKPKAKDGASDEKNHFLEIRLFLRENDFLPARIHIVNDEESKVVISVADYKINQKIFPANAQLTLPEGTDVFENDQKVKEVGPGGEKTPPLSPELEKSLGAPEAAGAEKK
jgi:outer membrane lipoprotein-sorting protein